MTVHRARTLAYLIIAVAITLPGCQPAEDVATEPTAPPPTVMPTATATVSPTPTETASESRSTDDWVTCDNHDTGYRVQHPQDWKTNDGDVLPLCSLFDPDDVDVERGTEIPFSVAVVVRVEPVPLSRAAEEGRAEEEIGRDETRIAGRDAVRREVESTGEALRPAGLRSTLWLVSFGDDETLIAATHDAGSVEYDQKQQVLDRMVASLELDEE